MFQNIKTPLNPEKALSTKVFQAISRSSYQFACFIKYNREHA